ncbi:MAG: hypothetical protein GY941_00985 [Planctomycetes bacterium]|nr:hypothetical protein [Planctomycetota bacterium]
MSDDKIGKENYIGKNDRPWPNSRLKRAAIIGHTDSTNTRLWFRTASKGKFTVLIYERPDGVDITFRSFNNNPYRLDLMPGEVRRVPFSITDWDTDTTHVIPIDNLKSGTEYAYALYADNDEKIIIGQDRPHFFRTMPQDDKTFSFALYSCNRGQFFNFDSLASIRDRSLLRS